MTSPNEILEKNTQEYSSETLLELQDVKKHFPVKSGLLQKTVGHIKAVDGINLKVNKGETLGIVGESGCGKSTVGRTIIRLYEPTDGKIIFSGRDISHLSESELRKDVRKNIQMIFRIRSRLLTLGKH